MKLVSIAEGKAKLSEYVEECRRHAVVLTKHGHPRAALVPLEDDDDLERFLLSRNARFLALMARSAATPRVSLAEAKRLISRKRVKRLGGKATRREEFRRSLTKREPVDLGRPASRTLKEVRAEREAGRGR